MKYHMELVTVTGEHIVSDTADESEESLDRAENVLEKFNLTTLYVNIKGRRVYFNSANVVSITLVREDV